MKDYKSTKDKESKKRHKIRKYFRRIILLINLLLAALLLISYLSTFISPVYYHWIAFLGLIYPVLLITNILMVIYWLLLRSKKSLISIVAIIIGFNHIGDFFTINFEDKIPSGKSKVEVLSYNVRVFNRWNWIKNKNKGAEIINFIKNKNANIVCLQEFYSDKKHGNNDSAIKDNSGLQNSHISYSCKNNITYNSGIATFSNYPIINKGKISINNNDNFCIYTDLKINNKVVRVYNVHLKSIHLGYNDYDFLKNLNRTDTIDVKGAKSIFQKMKRSYVTRAKQADLIASNIKKCSYPVILCGDFNDVPMSYAYHTIRNSLNDAFRMSGNGIQETYTETDMPFRIDFILYSKNIQAYNFNREKVSLSDHYPINCTLQLPN